MAKRTRIKTKSPYFSQNSNEELQLVIIPGDDVEAKSKQKIEDNAICNLDYENNLLYSVPRTDNNNPEETTGIKTSVNKNCQAVNEHCANEQNANEDKMRKTTIESVSDNNELKLYNSKDRASMIKRSSGKDEDIVQHYEGKAIEELSCDLEKNMPYITDDIKYVSSKYFDPNITETVTPKYNDEDEQITDHMKDTCEETDDAFRLSQESDSFQSSQISEEDSERELLCHSQLNQKSVTIDIKPFFNISPRQMPESPHFIIEEEFKDNPWIMLVATIFLTKTTALVAKPVMKQFFADYPTPLSVIVTNPVDLEVYFETLGMRKRAGMIWRMSYQFISGKWRRASDLCGIGKYGEDAFRLFCLGHTDIEPSDRYLRLYLDWLKMRTDYTQDWSISDCEKIIVDPVNKYYTISLR